MYVDDADRVTRRLDFYVSTQIYMSGFFEALLLNFY